MKVPTRVILRLFSERESTREAGILWVHRLESYTSPLCEAMTSSKYTLYAALYELVPDNWVMAA